METPVTSDLKRLSWSAQSRSSAAFSLIEIAIALGIISFAFVAIFGMIPVGMSTFRKAMDTSVGSQIAQRVINDAQQSDFDQLAAAVAVPLPMRFFDDQGNELTSAGDQSTIYRVNTRVVSPTAVPSSAGGATNADLATVAVQVARNPGNIPLNTANGLWIETGSVPIVTYSAYVARNSPKAANP